MNLSIYVEDLRRHLAVAAETGKVEDREVADRISALLEPSVRLVLLDAVTTAADEITTEMAPGTVEVRLRAGEPTFVVTPPPGNPEEPAAAARHLGPDTAMEADDTGVARLNLRLPEGLKARIEQAARAEGLSINAWLVRTAAAAVSDEAPRSRRNTGGGERYTGWVS
jgi:hypothetical protein